MKQISTHKQNFPYEDRRTNGSAQLPAVFMFRNFILPNDNSSGLRPEKKNNPQNPPVRFISWQEINKRPKSHSGKQVTLPVQFLFVRTLDRGWGLWETRGSVFPYYAGCDRHL